MAANMRRKTMIALTATMTRIPHTAAVRKLCDHTEPHVLSQDKEDVANRHVRNIGTRR